MIQANSFNFGIENSFDKWGIKVIEHDVFSPQKRARKQQIPFRNGMYDYGAKNYEERTLQLECVLTKQLTKSDFREIIYWLSQKNRIFLWDEPDKHYVGELYDSVDVNVFSQEKMRTFTLPFVCEPFAYGKTKIQTIQQGLNKIDYKGTAETPTLIILKNNTNYPISDIIITVTEKEI